MDFETLLLRCADKAYNVAFRLAGNEQDAKDLVQEAFSRVFTHKDRYDPSRPLEAWVHRILRNIFLDWMRRYERKHSVSIDAPTPTEDDSSWESILPGRDEDPMDRLIKEEQERLMQEALAALPANYRAAVVFSDIEGIPYAEIAKITNAPLGTVCSRVHQGRILLRKHMEKSYEHTHSRD
jgi:RNA polymerase sigma-70 factor (ECF subfamily)